MSGAIVAWIDPAAFQVQFADLPVKLLHYGMMILPGVDWRLVQRLLLCAFR